MSSVPSFGSFTNILSAEKKMTWLGPSVSLNETLAGAITVLDANTYVTTTKTLDEAFLRLLIDRGPRQEFLFRVQGGFILPSKLWTNTETFRKQAKQY